MANLNAIIYRDESGVYCAEVPALPGCYTDGDTIEDVKRNLQEAIQLYLEVSESEVANLELPAGSKVLEVAV